MAEAKGREGGRRVGPVVSDGCGVLVGGLYRCCETESSVLRLMAVSASSSISMSVSSVVFFANSDLTFGLLMTVKAKKAH